jgi:hypothetical protein
MVTSINKGSFEEVEFCRECEAYSPHSVHNEVYDDDDDEIVIMCELYCQNCDNCIEWTAR